MSPPSIPLSASRNSTPYRRRATKATRENILDVAERLFAHDGYDGTSIRDVAKSVGVQIAVISYHFGPKESLFETVIERRAALMADRRLGTLERHCEAAAGSPISLDALIEGYVWPFIDWSAHGGEGWKNYAHLIARVASSPRWAAIISKHYDSVARQYLAEFRRALPNTPPNVVHLGFSFMVGTMLYVCAESGEIDRRSDGAIKSGDIEKAFQCMLPFVRGGFLTLASRHLETASGDAQERRIHFVPSAKQ
jgi:AcrR family transcriptional regulator